jgi:hypothetical protein
MKQSDYAGEGGARIGGTDEGTTGLKFAGYQETTGAGVRGCSGGFAISDEGDFMRTGRFQSRDTDYFQRPIAFPVRSQMIRNI